MRHTLKTLRLGYGLTQRQMAEATGTTKEYYGLIENGKRVGVLAFWLRLQKHFNLSDAQLWDIAKEGVVFEGKTKVSE